MSATLACFTRPEHQQRLKLALWAILVIEAAAIFWAMRPWVAGDTAHYFSLAGWPAVPLLAAGAACPFPLVYAAQLQAEAWVMLCVTAAALLMASQAGKASVRYIGVGTLCGVGS